MRLQLKPSSLVSYVRLRPITLLPTKVSSIIDFNHRMVNVSSQSTVDGYVDGLRQVTIHSVLIDKEHDLDRGIYDLCPR